MSEGIRDETLKVTTPGGHEFAIKLCIPADANGPLILMVPGMGIRAGKYLKPCHNLAERSMIAGVMDLRGHGTSSLRASRTCHFGYREMLDEDLSSAVAALKRQFPNKPVYLYGHSLGGQISCLFASANPGSIDGLILTASCSIYYRNYPFAGLSLFFMVLLVKAITAWYGYFPGKRFGFAHLEAAQVMKDWSRQALTGKYQIAGSPLDYESLLSKMEQKLLVMGIEGDPFAPERAIDHLCAKMKRSHITRLSMNLSNQKPGKGRHFHWVDQFKPFGDRIQSWLSAQP